MQSLGPESGKLPGRPQERQQEEPVQPGWAAIVHGAEGVLEGLCTDPRRGRATQASSSQGKGRDCVPPGVAVLRGRIHPAPIPAGTPRLKGDRSGSDPDRM